MAFCGYRRVSFTSSGLCPWGPPHKLRKTAPFLEVFKWGLTAPGLGSFLDFWPLSWGGILHIFGGILHILGGILHILSRLQGVSFTSSGLCPWAPPHKWRKTVHFLEVFKWDLTAPGLGLFLDFWRGILHIFRGILHILGGIPHILEAIFHILSRLQGVSFTSSGLCPWAPPHNNNNSNNNNNNSNNHNHNHNHNNNNNNQEEKENNGQRQQEV